MRTIRTALLVCLAGGLALLPALSFLAGCGVPYAVRYRVEAGEDVRTIALRHGLTEEEVRRFNRLEPGDRVEPGDILFLPGGGRPEPLPAAEVARTPAATPRAPALPTSPGAVSPAPPPSAAAEPVQPRPAPAPAPPPPPAPPPAPPPGAQASRAPLAWPADGPVLRGFGRGPAGESRGIDIAVEPGTPVRAAGRGTVTYAGTPASAYGPLVILEHEGGLFTVYGNLRDYRVERGARVEAGETLGTSGARDPTLPPHLHFEVRRGQEPADPLLFLPPR